MYLTYLFEVASEFVLNKNLNTSNVLEKKFVRNYLCFIYGMFKKKGQIYLKNNGLLKIMVQLKNAKYTERHFILKDNRNGNTF